MSEPSLLDVALRYHKAGWHPIELPAGAKAPPPDGRTGYGGSDMTKEDIEVAAWVGNVGLRMPTDVIGLDVDVYHGGDVTLDDLFRRCGPLPNSWISHSGRGDGSGIRFYRVPPGLAWVAGLAGLEIIQRGHRYAVAWPSVHPDGRRYGWVNQDEGPTVEVPAVEDLPELPWAWISELSRAAPADTSAPSRAVDVEGLAAFVDAHETADQPGYVSTILAHFTERWRAGYSRHDTMQHCLTWAMECARAGVASAAPTIDAFGRLWVDAVGADARRAELWSERRTTEFEAMVRHAVGKVVAKTDDEVWEIRNTIVGPTMRPGREEPEQIDVDHHAEAEDGLPRPIDWVAFEERDEADRTWLVEAFWPWGRAMALWAAAKAGKSELALWCAARLALGQHPWTGDPVEPVDVAYFDFEMTEDDLDDRLAAFGISPRTLDRLHYFLLPALHALDVEEGGREVERLAARHGARAVIFDTFGRAVVGEENSADTVRAFYRHTGSRLKRAGIAYLRTDHAGKDHSKGQRGTSAKRDDIDIVWSLKRADGGGVLLDCSGSSRLGWVKPRLKVDRVEANGVVSYSAAVRIGWPAGVGEKVKALDALKLPLDVSRRVARDSLQAAGVVPGANDLLTEALRFRRERGAAGAARSGPPADHPGAEERPDGADQ